MENAIGHFKREFPSRLKEFMNLANYTSTECEENNESYISFFSHALISLSKMIFQLKIKQTLDAQILQKKKDKFDYLDNDHNKIPTSRKNRISKKSNYIHTSIPPIRSAKLVATTKKHYIVRCP